MSAPQSAPGAAARGSWILFDWATQPFYTLVTTFLFAPYFASAVVGDTAHGQALWGFAVAAAGLAVAFLGPILGSVADATGRVKVGVAFCSVLLVVGMSALWFAVPGASDERITLVLLAVVVATLGAEFATVFTNSMLPRLARPGAVGRLSGYGWATGYVGGILALFLMTGLVVVNPETGRTMLGLEPVLPLDLGAREGDRVVGPFSAVWYVLFALPLFLFVPDRPGSGLTLRAAIATGFASLVQTIREVRRYRVIALFLLARMVYTDGLGAIFTFGGIYAASVFGWAAYELGLFGIVLAGTAAVGAAIGGSLDDRLGSKRVITASLWVLLLCALAILSIDKDHVLFVVETTPNAAGDPPFSSVSEQVYLFLGSMIGFVAGPLQSASRSALARMAPPDKVGEFFGLFAFSGKVTAFAAPLLVATVTAMTDSQRWGISTIALFLIFGLVLVRRLRF